MIINAFILAAGLGERLRPISNYIPKPLLSVIGKPLIERIAERLYPLSDRIGINLHYKADMMREWAKNSPFSERIELFFEDPILGTGGALKNAEGFLSAGYFLVHNSDIISDIDLSCLIKTHLAEGNLATLATHDHPKYNNIVLDDMGYVIGVQNKGNSMDDTGTEGRRVAFTGIAIYSPEFLRFLPEGSSHVTVAWLAATKAGYKVKAIDFTGSYWIDTGTPEAYATAIVDALKREGENIYIHPEAELSPEIKIDGYISIEGGCTIKKGSTLRNCIILKGCRLEKGDYRNSIIGPDFEIKLDEGDFLGVNNGLVLIGTGGSDRRYYRATAKQMEFENGSKTVIFVKYPPDDHDFERHIEYTRFFRRHKIPVPELIRVDTDERTAIFEDLGDTSLYNWLKLKRETGQIETMYRKVIDMATSIHLNLTKNISECPLLRERVFDYNHFRWETDYFIERFLKPFYGKEIGDSVYSELDRLALRADSYPKTVIHRDFQSQNIMIKDDEPRIIDYQGARIGPPAYDIASILWDPYYRMADALRERLLKYYIMKMSVDTSFDPDGFLNSLLPCRLQRHMQALGAYGFLSVVKGKRYFLKFVPEALRMLNEEITTLKGEYPSLFDLISHELIKPISPSNNKVLAF